MKHALPYYLSLALACGALTLPMLSTAQPLSETPRTGPASEASPLFQRHHAMAGIMQDMEKEMARMQEEMAAGPPTPEAQHDMAVKMKRMARLMQRMSGLADRPTMETREMQRQYERMRREMDEMKKGH